MNNQEKFSWAIVRDKMHIITVIVVFLLDQASKYAIMAYVPLGTYVEVTPFFNLAHSKNSGAAFGMFNDASPIFRLIFFGAVTILCLYLLIFWLVTISKNYWL